MSYHVKRQESVRHAVRRIGCERIDHALACLAQQDPAKAAHDVRKDVKKARAAMRLVQHSLSRKECRRLQRALRHAAAALGDARDAIVTAAALEALADRSKGQFASRALRQIRADLRTHAADALQQIACKRVRRALHRARRWFQSLTPSITGWKALRAGVQSTYRAGRRGHTRALAHPSAGNLHRWRKRVKDLWYQLRLLQRMWPEQIDALSSELKKLADALGEDHDSVMLQHDVAARHLRDERTRDTLNGLVKQRRRVLQAEAFALGAHCYAEKPARFCARLGQHWHAWRRRRPIATTAHAAKRQGRRSKRRRAGFNRPRAV